MKNLNGLLCVILDELNQGHIVAIFLNDLTTQKEMYGEPFYIDYSKFGFDKSNILDAIRELEAQKQIITIDSGNMGWWITKYTEQ